MDSVVIGIPERNHLPKWHRPRYSDTSKLVRNGWLHPIFISHMDIVRVWINLLNPITGLTNGTRLQSAPGSSLRATAASGAKRSLKIAGEARVAHELLTDNLFDLAGAQRG
jgi:hypothetical protein